MPIPLVLKMVAAGLIGGAPGQRAAGSESAATDEAAGGSQADESGRGATA